MLVLQSAYKNIFRVSFNFGNSKLSPKIYIFAHRSFITVPYTSSLESVCIGSYRLQSNDVQERASRSVAA